MSPNSLGMNEIKHENFSMSQMKINEAFFVFKKFRFLTELLVCYLFLILRLLKKKAC